MYTIASHAFQTRHWAWVFIHPACEQIGKARESVDHTSRGRGLLDVGDKISALLRLLKARKDHFCAGNVLLGVLQVLEKRVLLPRDALEFTKPPT